MDRECRHPVVVRKDISTSITLVHVEVNNQNALQAVVAHGHRGRDGNVVERAEALAAVREGLRCF